MNRTTPGRIRRPLQHWLLGMALLCAGIAAGAQPGPQGQIARLNQQQGTVSVVPACQDRWQAARQGSALSVGDRVWTDRNARAELYIGPVALRLAGQTQVEFSGLDANFVDITASQGELQLRVRDRLAGQSLKIHTGNLHAVIDAPGEYRIAADTATSTTWVAVASGQLTLYSKNGASQLLTARQQTTVSGRDLTAVQTQRVPNAGFDAWVAERDRIEDRSGTARYSPPGLLVQPAVVAVPQPQVRYESDYRAQQEQQLAWQREQDWRQQQDEFRRQEDWRREQEWRQQEDWRQQREWQQRREWRDRAEQDRWQQQQQQQQVLRQQQEMQLRAAQAQAQQQQQLLQQQQRAAQQAAQAQQQQLQLRQQQEMQLRAMQMQQQVQAQQAAQQNALRQAQEAQLRAMQQQQRGLAATQQQQQQGQSEDLKRLWTSPDSR
jgi:hypothetical protein